MNISIDDLKQEIDSYMNHQQSIITKYADYKITHLSYETICNLYNGKLGGHNSYHDINDDLHPDMKQWISINLPTNISYIRIGPMCNSGEFTRWWVGGFDCNKNHPFESTLLTVNPINNISS